MHAVQDVGALIVDVLGGILVNTLIAFLLSIVLLIILNRLKLLKRHNRIGKILSGFYYVYIPLSIAMFTFGITTVYKLESATWKATNATINVLDEALYPAYNEFMNETFGAQYSSATLPPSDQLVDDYFLKGESSGAGFEFKRWMLITLLDHSKKEMEDQTGLEQRVFEDGLYKGIYDSGFIKIRDEAKASVTQTFKTPKILFWVCIIFVLLPFIEIYVGKRKEKSAKKG